MDNNQQLSLLDILNILSFIIGLLNLNENLTQGDKQDLMKALDNKTSLMLDEIHQHLQEQDVGIKTILKKLEALTNDT